MNISRLVLEFLLLSDEKLVGLASCENIIEGLLVFLLVLVCLLGAWQLLDEKDVYYLNELVFNQLIV